MKQTKLKYLCLLLETIHREHVMTNVFDLEYRSDRYLEDFRDACIPKKYGTHKDIVDRTSCAHSYDKSRKFWTDKGHLVDIMTDQILDTAWDEYKPGKTSEAELEAMVKRINRNIKKTCKKIHKILEEIKE